MSGRTKTLAYGAVGESSTVERNVVFCTLRASTTSKTTSSFAAASCSCARSVRSSASAALSDRPQASDAARSSADATAPMRIGRCCHQRGARRPRRATSRRMRSRSSTGGRSAAYAEKAAPTASPTSSMCLSTLFLHRARALGSVRLDRATELLQREARPLLHCAEWRRGHRGDVGLRKTAEIREDDDAALFRRQLAHRGCERGVALGPPGLRLDRGRGIGRLCEKLLDLFRRGGPPLAAPAPRSRQDVVARNGAEPRGEPTTLRVERRGLVPELHEDLLSHIIRVTAADDGRGPRVHASGAAAVPRGESANV